MITPEMVIAEMKKEVGFVCATCLNYWWSKDRNLVGCKPFHEGKTCSGPLGGNHFPEYKGVLSGKLHKVCFVCGMESELALEMPMKGVSLVRNIGVCKQHVKMLEDYSQKWQAPKFITGKSPVKGIRE